MITTLLVTLVILLICIAFGDAASRVFKADLDNIQKIILGLALVNSAALIVSLFYPLNHHVFFVFAAICVFYMVFNIKRLWDCIVLKAIAHKRSIVFTSPFLVIGFLLMQEPPASYDTGLYHFQCILWNEKYAVVKGLANIHGRFGFNSSIFMTHTLFSMSKYFGQHLFCVNYMLYSVGCYLFVKTIMFSHDNNLIKTVGFGLLFWAFLSMDNNLTSPAPDYISNGLMLISGVLLIKSKKHSPTDLMFLAVVFTFIITVKLSFLFLVLFVLFLIYHLYIKRKTYFWFAGILILFVLFPWLFRNYILSGYLIYPFAGIDLLSPAWKVPLDRVIAESNAVKGWARYPFLSTPVSSALPFNVWFPHWWKWDAIRSFTMVLLSISVCFNIVHLIKTIRNVSIEWFFSFVLLIIVIFWFCMAPDPRFIWGVIYLTFMMTFIYVDKLIESKNSFKVSFTVLLILFSIYLINNISTVRKNIFPSVVSGRLKLPKSLHYYSGRPKMDSFIINQTTFYYPQNSKDNDQCFDHCIPCMPAKDTLVRFLGNGFQDGFYISKP